MLEHQNNDLFFAPKVVRPEPVSTVLSCFAGRWKTMPLQPLEVFWATLADGKHGFTPQEVAVTRQTLSIGAFVKNSLPLVTNLQQGFAGGTCASRRVSVFRGAHV